MRSYSCIRKTLFHLSISIALLAFAMSRSCAADTTAELTGAIKDASGAVISNATLTLTNSATQSTQTTRAHGDGSYVFPGLAIGTYQLRIEAKGFTTSLQDKITLNVNQHARLDVNLQVSALQETVEVNANISQVDTQGATLGSVETTR